MQCSSFATRMVIDIIFLLAEFDEGSISIKIRPFENCTESDMVFIKIDSRSGRMMIDVDEKIRGNFLIGTFGCRTQIPGLSQIICAF